MAAGRVALLTVFAAPVAECEAVAVEAMRIAVPLQELQGGPEPGDLGPRRIGCVAHRRMKMANALDDPRPLARLAHGCGQGANCPSMSMQRSEPSSLIMRSISS